MTCINAKPSDVLVYFRNTFAPARVTIPAHKTEFPSNFFKMSYKISLLKNGFVTLFLIRFSYTFQKIMLNSSRIGRCTICVLILGFSLPKLVKKTKNPIADDKNCKIFSRHIQEPITLSSNQDTWFTTKPNPLSLTQSENYSFGASFDKILSNYVKI